jgi:hypothetical protein
MFSTRSRGDYSVGMGLLGLLPGLVYIDLLSCGVIYIVLAMLVPLIC